MTEVQIFRLEQIHKVMSSRFCQTLLINQRQYQGLFDFCTITLPLEDHVVFCNVTVVGLLCELNFVSVFAIVHCSLVCSFRARVIHLVNVNVCITFIFSWIMSAWLSIM
jgi:hypothetical protein